MMAAVACVLTTVVGGILIGVGIGMWLEHRALLRKINDLRREPVMRPKLKVVR